MTVRGLSLQQPEHNSISLHLGLSGEVVSAFGGLEGWEQFADDQPEPFDGALCRLVQQRLELC